MATNRMLKSAIIATSLIIIAAGLLKLYRAEIETAVMKDTSNVGSIVATFTIGIDPWIGYAPVGSEHLTVRARSEGIVLRYDAPRTVDYAVRMDQLRRGEIDFAVATVDAALLNNPDFNRSGVIVAVLDQSTGGDALVCDHTRIAGIDDFNQKSGWKVAFTPNSPSHHLLRAIGRDFGIETFLAEGNWRKETNGSSAALAALNSGDVDCAVLWQPDVTRATRDSNELSVVYSSEEVDGLIVDVLMVHRPHLLPTSPVRPHIETVLRHYFETVRRFSEESDFALQEVTTFLRTYDGGKYTQDEVVAMMNGVSWVNLTANAESWFGVGGESPYFKLEQTFNSALVIIQQERGTNFGQYFAPQGIIDGRYIASLYKESTIREHNATITNPLELRFPELRIVDWNALTTQGTLRSRRIVFHPGSLILEESAIIALKEAMSDFKRYPYSRLEIQVGHSSNIGDSEARVTATRQYLIDTYKIDPNRLRARVLSPEETQVLIPRGENDGRAYNSRLREVRLVLVRPDNQS